MTVFWYNGEYIPMNTPVFTALSRNVNYGDGIFETIRINNRKIYFWDFHFERLQKGIHVLQLNPDVILQNKTLLQDIILTLAEQNKIKHSAKVKIQVYREGSILLASQHTKTFIFCVETLPDCYEVHSKETIIYPDIALQYSVLSPLKTLNRLPYILAGIYAQAHNVEDAILLNTQHELTESTHSNLFYIMDNELYTPPLSSGCLEGVMRRVIMQHFKVTEKPLTINEVKKTQSLFTTNVIRGISPILTIKGIDKIFDVRHLLIKEIFEFLNTSIIQNE
jgi:branched-chain amino acid aminotransferase